MLKTRVQPESGAKVNAFEMKLLSFATPLHHCIGVFFLEMVILSPEKEMIFMETRIAILGIIVENTEYADGVNQILHEYGSYIVGRMGIPYRERKLSVISVIIDASTDVIGALSGKLGMLEGVSVKTVYSKE